MDFVCLSDRGLIHEQQKATQLKELELQSKTQRLRTQRVLLERNLHSVTDKQSHLQAKEEKLADLRRGLVNKQAELQQSSLVLSQQEKVVRQSVATLEAKLTEARRNKSKCLSLRDTVTARLEAAENLYAELLTEEQSLSHRQSQLTANEASLSVAKAELDSANEQIAPRWSQYQQYLSDLELEKRSQGLQRIRSALANRESQLRDQIRLFEENNLQLRALNSELSREQQELADTQHEVTTRCVRLEDKRDTLEVTLQRYEQLKLKFARMQDRQTDATTPNVQSKEAELYAIKTHNRELAAAISSLSSNYQSKKKQIAEIKASVSKRESELQNSISALKSKEKELTARRSKVKKTENDLSEMAELEGRMDGKLRKMIDSEEDWKRMHSSELQAIKEYMARIDQKEQRLMKHSPVRAARSNQ